MKGKITVTKVSTVNGRLEVLYNIDGEVRKYFKPGVNTFWAEYNENIDSVPQSIAVIPFVGNVLPIVWLADAELVVDELDKTFYECLPEVRHGYILLSPMLDFLGGRITVKRVIDNGYHPSQQEAVLFSGGVDAFATLFNHVYSKPMLITLHGSDIALDDEEGWRVVSTHVNSTAKILNLPEPRFVKTNFREFIAGKEWRLIRKSGESWWHGYQHGLGIISHAAPIAWLHKLNRIYIASSYSYEYKVICASDPVIDSHVRFAGTEVRHDGYYMNRIDKVKKIVDVCESSGKNIQLRVCYISRGGHNCCKCEKCIRTIFNILAVNGNPERYGFNMVMDVAKQYKNIVMKELADNKHIRFYWHPIQDYIKLHRPTAIIDNTDYNWILNLNIDKNRPIAVRLYRKFKNGLHKIQKGIRQF